MKIKIKVVLGSLRVLFRICASIFVFVALEVSVGKATHTHL